MRVGDQFGIGYSTAISNKGFENFTIGHELGHYFGNPHSPTPNNIMSYTRDGVTPPFFDSLQIRRIRTHAGRFVRAGVAHE